MTAKATIPAVTLFQKFLIISGLRIPVAYVCTYLLEPICDRIIERLDPAVIYQIQAEGVRGVAKETEIECFPLMLNEREACPTCGKLVLMLVQPENACFDCWPDALDSN
jgi:hypothetical protein